jgi:hypothetical protein
MGVFSLSNARVASPWQAFAQRFSGCTDCNGQHTTGARLLRGGASVRLSCEGGAAG